MEDVTLAESDTSSAALRPSWQSSTWQPRWLLGRYLGMLLVRLAVPPREMVVGGIVTEVAGAGAAPVQKPTAWFPLAEGGGHSLRRWWAEDDTNAGTQED